MTDKHIYPSAPDAPSAIALQPSATPVVWRVAAAAGLMLGVVGLVVAGLLWQRVNLTQQELARRSQDAGVQAGQARSMAEQAQQMTQVVQARLALAEARLSEVALQRSQLDELMDSLSRSRDDTLVYDLSSTLRLAQQQTQLTGSVAPLVAALQSADERIARAALPRLNPVQRAIAQDLERIRLAPLNDVASVVMRIDELSRQVDDWPLMQSQPYGVVVTEPLKQASLENTNAPPWLQSLGGWWSEHWQTGWAMAVQQFQQLVRISRIDTPEAALLVPDQAFFLRENIKLRLLNVRLALMARQGDVVRADLEMVQTLLQRYFRRDSPGVVHALSVVSRVGQQAVDIEVPGPDDTLAALAKASGARR